MAEQNAAARAMGFSALSEHALVTRILFGAESKLAFFEFAAREGFESHFRRAVRAGSSPVTAEEEAQLRAMYACLMPELYLARGEPKSFAAEEARDLMMRAVLDAYSDRAMPTELRALLRNFSEWTGAVARIVHLRFMFYVASDMLGWDARERAARARGRAGAALPADRSWHAELGPLIVK